ncbi:Elongation factor G [Fasciola gigantica]|uniref:Elongation factor G n=1 Tax=Fasciola gigantica TaxID=46835 RepID=A0A504YEX1_FASGI|nr:Elongation factor G [Fasciola gigantica]
MLRSIVSIDCTQMSEHSDGLFHFEFQCSLNSVSWRVCFTRPGLCNLPRWGHYKEIRVIHTRHFDQTVLKRRNTQVFRLSHSSPSPDGVATVKLIRNVGVIAHIDAGKTTTTERMLYLARRTHHLGEVDRGDTVTDYLPEERDRGISIVSATACLTWRNHTLHLLDTPGHVDFTMEVERSLCVMDGAIIILDGTKGVQAQTRTVWHQADRYHLPRLVYVNKLDRDTASLELSLTTLSAQLASATQYVAIHWPVLSNHLTPANRTTDKRSNRLDARNRFVGLVDLTSMKFSVRNDIHLYAMIKAVLQLTGDHHEVVQRAGPGSIVALSGLQTTRSGDLLGPLLSPTSRDMEDGDWSGDSSEAGFPSLLKRDPVVYAAIEPTSLTSVRNLEHALVCMQREDPSFTAHLNPETGQWAIGGMGDLHLEVVMARLKREYKVDAHMGPLLIAYKECPLHGPRTEPLVVQGHGYSSGLVDGREKAFLVDVVIEAFGQKTPQVSLDNLTACAFNLIRK